MNTTARAFHQERAWRYPDFTGGQEDAYILVNGERIGGTYWCGADYIPAGQEWASYGPAGLLYAGAGFATREAAEAAQVDAYKTDPDGFDRLRAEADAETAVLEAARQTRQDAETAARRDREQRARLGDDAPGPTVWTAPAYHALCAPRAETAAVAAWLAEHGAEPHAGHPIRVEQRATRLALVFEEPTALAHFAAAMQQPATRTDQFVQTRVVTVRSDPPPVTVADRPELHALFAEHQPARFPLIDYGANIACGACTKTAHATTTAQLVLWPCPPIAAAIA